MISSSKSNYLASFVTSSQKKQPQKSKASVFNKTPGLINYADITFSTNSYGVSSTNSNSINNSTNSNHYKNSNHRNNSTINNSINRTINDSNSGNKNKNSTNNHNNNNCFFSKNKRSKTKKRNSFDLQEYILETYAKKNKDFLFNPTFSESIKEEFTAMDSFNEQTALIRMSKKFFKNDVAGLKSISALINSPSSLINIIKEKNNLYSVRAISPQYIVEVNSDYYFFDSFTTHFMFKKDDSSGILLGKPTISNPRPYPHPFVHSDSSICYVDDMRWKNRGIIFSQKRSITPSNKKAFINDIAYLASESLRTLREGYVKNAVPIHRIERFSIEKKISHQAAINKGVIIYGNS